MKIKRKEHLVHELRDFFGRKGVFGFTLRHKFLIAERGAKLRFVVLNGVVIKRCCGSGCGSGCGTISLGGAEQLCCLLQRPSMKESG